MTTADTASTPASTPATTDSAEVAVPDKTKVEPKVEPLDPDWPYDRLEWHGDNLAVRLPELQALMAYQVNTGKYVPEEKQNNAAGLFVVNHFGTESYDRVMERMLSPDDPDYTVTTYGQLLGELVRRAIEKIKASGEDKKLLEGKG